jgi:hypothetical protein
MVSKFFEFRLRTVEFEHNSDPTYKKLNLDSRFFKIILFAGFTTGTDFVALHKTSV